MSQGAPNPLTTEPHYEHHLRGDLVVSEKVQQERQREDVHCSAKKNQDLQVEQQQCEMSWVEKKHQLLHNF